MKLVYGVCSSLVLLVAVLVLSGRGTGHACSGTDSCFWSFNPQATQAAPAPSGAFDTATDGDANELTINWDFSFDPIGGAVSIDEGSSNNIAQGSVTYTPSEFATGGCLGGQVIYASGRLAVATQDGRLVTKATIGPFPACETNKTLAIDHS